MKIAIDKNSIEAVKVDGNDYIYIFDKESYQELEKLFFSYFFVFFS